MVLYEYAYDEKGSLIHISSITKENRRNNNYYCISCHEPMRPRLGDKNAHHFYHPNTSCSFESYIHKLGKELFYREYKKCLDEGTPFNVDIPQKTICSETESCPFHKGECELENQVNTYDLTEFFKMISIPETPDGDFIPDIYLESSKGEKLYIEIFCTSKCSDKKTTSGKRIIEIKAENISNIPCNYHGTKEKVQAIDANYFQEILNHHISGDNSTLYNFKGKEKAPDGECPIRVKGLILYQSGKCYIHEYSAIEYLQRKINKQNEVYCNTSLKI